MKKIKNFEEVSQMVVSGPGWIYVFGQLTNAFNEAIERLSGHVTCPFCGETQFRLYKDFDSTGMGICKCIGTKGPFMLLSEANVGDNAGFACSEVYKLLNSNKVDTLKYQPPKRVMTIEPSAREISQGISKFTHRYMKLKPSGEATASRRYLENRCLLPGHLTSRFNPAEDYYVQDPNDPTKAKLLGRFPAIVSPVMSPLNQIVGLHRIYITESGHKADVPEVKKLTAKLSMEANKGAAVRLYKNDESRILHLTEGVENGYAVRTVLGPSNFWATISAPMMPNVIVPKDRFDRVVIWADWDRINPNTGKRAGTEAANRLATRLKEEGFKVVIMVPNREIPDGAKSIDWEDIIVESDVISKKLSLLERKRFLIENSRQGWIIDFEATAA